MKLIVKKENYPEWISLKMIKKYHFKIIGYIMKIYYQLKGYEVEVIK